MKELKSFISNNNKLSIRKQCRLLDICHSSIYYQPKRESAQNLDIMRMMDHEFLEHPTHGVLQMQDYLRDNGLIVNTKRVRRLLRKMGIIAIYPQRNLSKLGQLKYIRPYLLRNLTIDHPNQVWAIDITYIPMAKGFMYLTAIIDVYSRYIVGWDISNSLETSNCLKVLKSAIAQYGMPQIINSDQGSQFTSHQWIDYLETDLKKKIKISMDSKGRAKDNIFIERFWRTIKRDYIYLFPAENGKELYAGIKTYVEYYNKEKSHQGICRQSPVSLYVNSAA
jgi:putative transposase